MQTRTIGTTTVSAIGLGGMQLSIEGRPEDRGRAVATVHAALDAGITLIDTAAAYPGSEPMLGEALEGRRHEAIVLTKYGHPSQGGPDGRAGYRPRIQPPTS